MGPSRLTLDAALVDRHSTDPRARSLAIGDLAPALLDAIGRSSPTWRAWEGHPRGPEVREALGELLRADAFADRGAAAIGLGSLGDVVVVETADDWSKLEADEPGVGFLVECGLIALAHLGSAARDAGDPASVVEGVVRRLRRALEAERPEARFQAMSGLVDLLGSEARSELLGALDDPHPEVRTQAMVSLSRLEDPGTEVLRAVARRSATISEDPQLAFEAALMLTGAAASGALTAAEWKEHRATVLERLAGALDRPFDRDRALEALAVAAAPLPSPLLGRIDALARSWWIPGVTRVRAAYALVAIEGPDGPHRAAVRLSRLAWHPRPSVRAAVDEARELLGRRGPQSGLDPG